MMEKSLTINNEDYEKYRPFRKVMVKTNLCYICYKTKNTFERDLDNHDGLYYRYGWLYCEDCENISPYCPYMSIGSNVTIVLAPTRIKF